MKLITKQVLYCFAMVLCFFASINIACAQRTNYNDIIHPDIDSNFISYEERLVQIAYRNYPLNRMFDARAEQARLGVQIAKLSWFNNLTFTSQYYSQLTPGKTVTDSLVFFPRLGVGFTVNVGGLLQTPAKIKQSRQELKVAEANLDAQKLFIRAETIRRYHLYLQNINLYKIQSQAVEDARTTAVLIRDRFEKGEVSVEDYNKALRLNTESMVEKVRTEQNIETSKATLEEMLGVKLEQITK